MTYHMVSVKLYCGRAHLADAMQTPDKIIQAALKLFSERGFYGASMDHIAREVGVTKQALIHHFGSKEKLYGAVLEDISGRLLADIAASPGASDGADAGAFVAAVLRIFERTQAYPADTQLLMRELLDNRRRAAQAGTWYLRPFLDGLRSLLRRQPGWDAVDEAILATHVYQLMGAINYFAVSATTLQNMYSEADVKAMRAQFPQQLHRLASAPPPT